MSHTIPFKSQDKEHEDKILNSWKEIALYLGRDVRTAQRWEKKEGLPVHRHLHEDASTVYAYAAEIDEWRSQRQVRDEPEEPVPAAKERKGELTSLEVGHRWTSKGLVIATVVTVAVVAMAFFSSPGLRHFLLTGENPPTIRSLAVLPLRSLSDDPKQELFAESMTEELITNLSQINGLRVASRNSVMHFKKSDKSLPEIARELNVDGIVEGSVLRSGDRVHITAQLVNAATDSNFWAQSYEGNLEDVLALQGTVATAIASAVKKKVQPENQVRTRSLRQVLPAALDANLEGRYHQNKWAEEQLRSGMGESSDEELKKAIASFEHAIQEDPNYAVAYVGLSDALLSHAPSPQSIERANAALGKAILLEDTGDTHLRLANLRMQYQWDWHGAEEEFMRALVLNPNSAEGHSAYADFLEYLGRMDEMKKERELAQELDPNHDRNTMAQYIENGFRSDASLEQDKHYLDERAPENGFARGMLATNYLRVRKYKDAVEQYEKTFTLYGYQNLVEALQPCYAKGDYKGSLRAASRELVDMSKHHYVPPFLPAFLFASLGDADQAVAWLERAYKEHDWVLLDLKNDPIWDPIRSDRRFKGLLRRVGLAS